MPPAISGSFDPPHGKWPICKKAQFSFALGNGRGRKRRKATDGGHLARFQSVRQLAADVKSYENIEKTSVWPKNHRNRGAELIGLALLHCMAAFGIGLPGGALRARPFSVMRV